MGIGRHIDMLWDQLTRTSTTAPRYSSLLPLPEPYVVPGGRFREMYYWDSYFTMLGLAESGRHDLLEHMVRDFASLIDTYGHIPNGTRNYYLSRSQPPFYFAMVGLLNAEDPAIAYERYLPQLRREYAFWMQGEKGLKAGAAHRRVVAMADGSILNRYWDDSDTPRDESYREDTELAKASGRIPKQLYRDLRAAAESGWDFGSRWFADGHSLATINTTQIIPIDLNSLLFGLEEAIRLGCEHAHESACASEFAHRSAARRESVNRYLWDAAAGVYRDYNWTNRAQVTRISAATLYPLFVAMATQAQASAVATAVGRDLLKSGGIVTTPQVTGTAMGRPQWLAAVAVDRHLGTASLLHYTALRHRGLPLDARRQSRLWRDRQIGGKVRCGDDRAGGRRRRISHAGRLRLDQWRHAQAHGALSQLQRQHLTAGLWSARHLMAIIPTYRLITFFY